MEAEAKAFQRQSARLVRALALLFVAAMLILAGAALWLWSAYRFTADFMPPAAAGLLTGLLALLAAGVVLWAVKNQLR